MSPTPTPPPASASDQSPRGEPPARGRRTAIWALALALAVVAGYFLLRPAPDADLPGPRVGEPAPDFVLETEDGSPVRLSQFRGQPVLINFWGTWCPGCDQEMPLLQQAFEGHRPAGLVLLGVNVGDTPAVIRAYKEKRGLNFLTVMDRDRFASRRYGANALPVTYFVDPKGIVRARYFGELDPQTLNRLLERIL